MKLCFPERACPWHETAADSLHLLPLLPAQNFLNTVVAGGGITQSHEEIRSSVAGAFDNSKALGGLDHGHESDDERDHFKLAKAGAVDSPTAAGDTQRGGGSCLNCAVGG